MIFPDLSIRTPPLPVGPGFPFEAPSAYRMCSFREDLHLINSCSSNLISHGSCCFVEILILVRIEGSSSWNQLCSLLSGVASLVIFVFEATGSPIKAFTLIATWADVPAISLKILLLRSSHTFQQRIFGTHIQHIFNNFILEREKGAKSGQKENKEVMERGRVRFS